MAVLTTLLLCRLVQCPQSCSPPLQLPCSLLGGYSVCLSLVPHSWELEDLGKWFGAGRLVGKKSGSHLVGKKSGSHHFQPKLLLLIPGVFWAWRSAHVLSSCCICLAAKISAGAFKKLSQDTQDEAWKVVWQHVKSSKCHCIEFMPPWTLWWHLPSCTHGGRAGRTWG